MRAEVTARMATAPSRRESRIKPLRIFIYAVLGLYTLAAIGAFVWVTMISLKSATEFITSSPWALPEVPRVENYISAWEKANIGSYFGNSAIAAGLGGGLSVLISALPAFAIARIPFKFNNALGNYFLVGYMVPMMLTVIPLYFAIRGLGLPGGGMIILIGLYIASGIPFNTFVLRGFFESLPTEMEEAAAVDGASPFRAFWQIMLPLAWPGLVSTFLINFLSLWNEFFLALIFLRKESATLPLGLFYMQQRAYYTAQWPDLFAGVLICIVPVLIVFALLQDQITRGMTSGAIKG